MSVILKETHEKILRRVKRRARFAYGILIALLITSLLFQWTEKASMDLIRGSYQTVKYHLKERQSKYILLEILRNKPLTVGQALEIADVIMDEARSSEVPIHVVLGIVAVESEFRADAVSTVGARGLMQIMPATWNMYAGGELLGLRSKHNAALNVRIGITYLGDLLKQYGDLKKVLTVYGGFVSKKPDRYVNLVMEKATQYKTQLE